MKTKLIAMNPHPEPKADFEQKLLFHLIQLQFEADFEKLFHYIPY